MRIVLLAFALVVPIVVACGAPARQEVAKEAYREQLRACVDIADTRDQAEACIHSIQSNWDDAGAQPAAKDSGK